MAKHKQSTPSWFTTSTSSGSDLFNNNKIYNQYSRPDARQQPKLIPGNYGALNYDTGSFDMKKAGLGTLISDPKAPMSSGDMFANKYNAAHIDTPAITDGTGFIDLTKSKDPYSDLGTYSPSIVKDSVKASTYSFPDDAPTIDNTTGYKFPVADKASSSTPHSYLGDFGNSLGFKGWGDGHSNGDTYKDSSSGKYMKSGMFTDSEAKSGDFANYNAFKEANPLSDLSEEKWNTNKFDQGRLDSQNFQNNMGLGMGAAQLGMSLFSTFGGNGSLAMNKKNMQVMDGQIANNNEIMATRKARAADIQKYFG